MRLFALDSTTVPEIRGARNEVFRGTGDLNPVGDLVDVALVGSEFPAEPRSCALDALRVTQKFTAKVIDRHGGMAAGGDDQ